MSGAVPLNTEAKTGVATPPTDISKHEDFPAQIVIIQYDYARGLTDPPPEHPPVTVQPQPIDSAPLNVDVPYASQAGGIITCTMGNWLYEPTVYAYQWQRDGTTNIGTNAGQYDVVAADVGHTITCIVSASNAAGTTVGPPSNGVVAASTETLMTQGVTDGTTERAGNYLDPFDGSGEHGSRDSGEAAV